MYVIDLSKVQLFSHSYELQSFRPQNNKLYNSRKFMEGQTYEIILYNRFITIFQVFGNEVSCCMY